MAGFRQLKKVFLMFLEFLLINHLGISGFWRPRLARVPEGKGFFRFLEKLGVELNWNWRYIDWRSLGKFFPLFFGEWEKGGNGKSTFGEVI